MKQEELFKPSPALVDKTKLCSADILESLIKKLRKIEKDGRETTYEQVSAELRKTADWIDTIWGRKE